MYLVVYDSFDSIGLRSISEIKIDKENLSIGINMVHQDPAKFESFSIIEGPLNGKRPFVVKINKNFLERSREDIFEPSIFSALQVMNLAKLISGEGRYDYSNVSSSIKEIMKGGSISPLGDSLHSKYIICALFIHVATSISKYNPEVPISSGDNMMEVIEDNLALAFQVHKETPEYNRHLVSKARVIINQAKEIYFKD